MGDFLDQVRRGLITQPVQRGFTLDLWAKAFEGVQNVDDVDKSLFDTAIQLHHILAELRGALQKGHFENLSRSARLAALCSIANHDVATIYAKVDAKLKTMKNTPHGADSIFDLANLSLDLPSGVSATPDQITTIIHDAIPLPLDETLRAEEKGESLTERNFQYVVPAFRIAGAYRGASNLWHDCLWSDEYSFMDGDTLVFQPRNQLQAKREAAADFRYANHIQELTNHAVQLWRNVLSKAAKKRLTLQRGVTAYDRDASNNPFIVGKTNAHNLANIGVGTLSWVALTLEYFGEFIDRPLPDYPAITIRSLYQVWLVLASLAKTFLTAIKQDQSDFDFFCSHSIKVSKGHLIGVLIRALNISENQAREYLAFLTYRPREDGLWQRPLVSLSEDEFLIFAGPLLHGNPERFAERWLRLGGYNLEKRGPIFEQYARNDIARIISGSKILKNAKVCEHPLDPADKTVGDVDIIIQVGDLILIGEAKCQLTAVDAVEVFRFRERLTEAAGQARRKAVALSKDTRPVIDALRLHPDAKLKFVPFVLSNHLRLSGFPVDGVAVTDLLFLQTLLGSGGLTKFAVLNRDGVQSPGMFLEYYRNEREAELKIPELLLDQPVVNDIIELVRPRIRPMPLSPSGKKIISRYFSVNLDSNSWDWAPKI